MLTFKDADFGERMSYVMCYWYYVFDLIVYTSFLAYVGLFYRGFCQWHTLVLPNVGNCGG